ncbi:hypothetical protein [Rhodanobacter lindaniclasticus]
MQPVAETRELLHRDGELKPGLGKISGVIALSLGFLCLLAVVAFHFPQYLTTPNCATSIRWTCCASCCWPGC